jgi:hypothetical protein
MAPDLTGTGHEAEDESHLRVLRRKTPGGETVEYA